MDLGPNGDNNVDKRIPKPVDEVAAKETNDEKEGESKDKKDKKEKEEEKPAEDVVSSENPRLYVMNLSYEVSHDELRSLFSKYGEVKNIEIPLRKGGKGQALGISYITFE